MWQYNHTPCSDELYHYGVQGMKWGKRKFQERGGSYTKKGLEVFDRKMKAYETADAKVKSLKKTGDKDAYRMAKGERREAKRVLNKSYAQVKRDYQADKGKNLYESGKTITGNLAVNAYAQGAIVIGSRIAQRIIASKTGNLRVANIAGNAIGIGGTVVNGILAGKTAAENKKLRAYYGHSRTVR